jgi:uncharacterized UBP type Zn finger protein
MNQFAYKGVYSSITSMKKIGNPSCTHLKMVNQKIHAKTQGCEECLKMDSSWVHLRLCLTCGHVGCCDDSINKHGTRHFHATNHPIIRSFESGEDWEWCFVDNMLLQSS